MVINDQCNPNSPATSIFPSSLVIYSGASNHMTFVDHHLNDTKPYSGTDQIVAITLYTPQIQSFFLPNVYFEPHLSANLHSIAK